MSEDVVVIVLQAIVVVLAFLIGKYVFPKVKANNKYDEIKETLSVLTAQAENYIHYAKEFIDGDGNDKMNFCVSALKTAAKKNGIEVSETELKAVIQKAYDAMVNAEGTELPTFIPQVTTTLLNTTEK